MVRQIVKNAFKLLAALIVGACVGVICLMFIAVSIDKAFADTQATPIREATSGEQDRSLNYRSTRGVQPSAREVEEDRFYTTLTASCTAGNRKRIAMLHMIAGHIARDPSKGPMYKQAILTIHETWCK